MPDPARSAQDVRHLLDQMRSDLDDRWVRLDAGTSSLTALEQQWRESSRAQTAADGAAADMAWARSRQDIHDSATTAATAARKVVAERAAQLTPGPFGRPWSDPTWTAPPVESAAGTHVRVGRLAGQEDELPVVLPAVGHAGWFVETGTEDFARLVRGVALRLFAALNPANVRLHVFDPELALDVGLFAGLRQVSQRSVPPALTSPDQLDGFVPGVMDELSHVDEVLSAGGYDSLWTAARSGHLPFPVRLLVLGGPLTGASDAGTARLLQLLRVGPERGLVPIVRAGCGLAPGPGAVRITAGPGGWTADVLPDVTWTPDPGPSPDQVRQVCDVIARAPRVDTGPAVEFSELVDAVEDAWTGSADEGLEAVIGRRDDRSPLVVRLRSEDPPMPNMLVGGAVGQGKSNLLLVLIHALAARYSPADLEMVLVDLRDGVEFARLGPDARGANWLPHVRALGLEYDADYCVGVLRWVTEEMTRRSDLLKAAGATKLKEYRLTTGRTIPRLLLVVDEFHRLFEGDDETVDTTVRLLEQIARTGRGFGVHLVLASQTVSGIRGLATKADAVFGQFHNRLSLKNTPAESAAILSPQNGAAASLEHRGQVVLNDGLGLPEHNVVGAVAKADDSFLRVLRQRLWVDGAGPRPPEIFRAGSLARPDGVRRDAAPGTLAADIGAAIGIDAGTRTVVLRAAAEQTLAVVGSRDDLAQAVLARAVVTALSSSTAPVPVTVLEGRATAASSWTTQLAERLRSLGCEVEVVPRESVGGWLTSPQAQTGPRLVVPVALDSCPGLDAPDPETFAVPADSLQRIVQTGALQGVHTIGWWQSRTLMERQLGFGAPGVRGWALCGVSRDDLSAVCGPLSRAPRNDLRVQWFDRSGMTAPETLVPFDPSDLVSPGEARG